MLWALSLSWGFYPVVGGDGRLPSTGSKQPPVARA